MSNISTVADAMSTALNNSTTMSNTGRIQQLYEAFGRGDVATILTQVTDDVDWDNSRVASKICPWNGNFSGKANLPGFFKAVGEELKFRVFDAHTFIESGNRVAVLLRIESNLAKNGHALENDVVHVWTFDDRGLVASYRHFNDTGLELQAWNA